MKGNRALFILGASMALLLSSCGIAGDHGSSTSFSDGSNASETSKEETTSKENTSKENTSKETTSRERETYDGIKVYCDPVWENIYAWTVSSGGQVTKLCGDWPGAKLKTAGDWKYYEFPNLSSINLIFNAGSQQTSDLSVEEKGVYYYHGSSWYDDVPGEETSGSQGDPDDFPAISPKNYRTFYQLLVYSFADGNNDGIGDFKGIIDHLSYLKDLGIGAIWLSPVQPSDSYHSYDCTDYYSIKSSYEVTVGGTKYDFKKLLDEAHKNDIKIVMDMVFNHTSRNHSWFREHNDWYSTKDNMFGFPEFDFDKTEVRKAIKDVGKYWLNQGVDGFRLDAAYWVYNSGTNRDKKNFEWWKEFSFAMKETKPDCYLVGEVLDANHDLAFSYTACGFDSTFDFEAPRQTYQAFNGKAGDFAGEVAKDQAKIDRVNPDAIMARALSNHDIGRFSHSHPTSSDTPYYIEEPNQLKIANALNVLTPGDAYIYYGDELGLKASTENGYQDMAYRTPMPFESGQTDSVKYFEGFKGNGKSSWSTLSGKSISEDQRDPYSAYSILKKAISIKNKDEVLQRGRVEASTDSSVPSGIIDYKIILDGKTTHFYCNTSKSAQASFNVQGSLKDTIVTGQDAVTLSNGKIVMPACSIAFVG